MMLPDQPPTAIARVSRLLTATELRQLAEVPPGWPDAPRSRKAGIPGLVVKVDPGTEF